MAQPGLSCATIAVLERGSRELRAECAPVADEGEIIAVLANQPTAEILALSLSLALQARASELLSQYIHKCARH